MDVHAMAVDLSHYDPADDYAKVKAAGIVGCIYKATQGQSWTDDTYVSQQHAARAEGVKWGGYHFADGSSVNGQIDNFMRFCCPDPDELFCLDWEDNNGNKMSAANAQKWIEEVERQLGRPGECVIYSGNTAKEALGSSVNTFFGSRRLWLCQYGSSPTVQKSWSKFWLWQYTDGVNGPSPHSISGVGNCDINSYNNGPPSQLVAEWATGKAAPPGPAPTPKQQVSVVVSAPAGIEVKTRVVVLPRGKDTYSRTTRHQHEAK